MSDSDPYCCFQIPKVESILDVRFVFLMLFSDLLVEPILMSVRFASICMFLFKATWLNPCLRADSYRYCCLSNPPDEPILDVK